MRDSLTWSRPLPQSARSPGPSPLRTSFPAPAQIRLRGRQVPDRVGAAVGDDRVARAVLAEGAVRRGDDVRAVVALEDVVVEGPGDALDPAQNVALVEAGLTVAPEVDVDPVVVILVADAVLTRAAVHDVWARTRADVVVPGAAGDPVGPAVADEDVGALPADQAIVPRAAGQPLPRGPARRTSSPAPPIAKAGAGPPRGTSTWPTPRMSIESSPVPPRTLKSDHRAVVGRTATAVSSRSPRSTSA